MRIHGLTLWLNRRPVVNIAEGSIGARNDRPRALAKDDVAHIARLTQVENNDGNPASLAKIDGADVHDPESGFPSLSFFSAW